MYVVCDEKHGVVVREVKPLVITPEKREWLAEKLRTVRNFLDDRGVDGLCDDAWQVLEVDDVGLIMLDKLENGLYARVHITFWDRRLRGRERLCRRVADYWIDKYDLVGVYTTIPHDAAMVKEFCKRVGFQEIETDEKQSHFLFSRRK
jgi:hypothetical protein